MNLGKIRFPILDVLVVQSFDSPPGHFFKQWIPLDLLGPRKVHLRVFHMVLISMFFKKKKAKLAKVSCLISLLILNWFWITVKLVAYTKKIQMVLCFRFVYIRKSHNISKSYLLVIYATILHVLIAYFIDVRCCCSHEMYSEKPGLSLCV